MKWTASFNSEDEPEVAPPQVEEQKSCKRKHPHSPLHRQVAGVSEAGVIVCGHQAGKIRAAVRRPAVTARRIRRNIVVDAHEWGVLQVQMAMISDEDGDRPIHVAVVHEDLKLVQKLCSLMLKAAISIDLTNFLRQTPLHLAVILGNVEMVRLLLKYGASLLVRDRHGNSVLHLAVKSGVHRQVLDILLSHPQAKIILNSMDHEGYSALHHAVFKNDAEAIRCLHQWGADINIVDGKSGRTALVHAVLEQNLDMAKLLLKCGACALKVDYAGRSPFELALQSSNVQVIKLLEKELPTNDLSASRASSGGSSSHYDVSFDDSTLKRTRWEAVEVSRQNIQ